MPFPIPKKKYDPLNSFEQSKIYLELSVSDKIEFLEMTKKRHCIECKFCAENGPPKGDLKDIDLTRIYLDKLCKKFAENPKLVEQKIELLKNQR